MLHGWSWARSAGLYLGVSPWEVFGLANAPSSCFSQSGWELELGLPALWKVLAWELPAEQYLEPSSTSRSLSSSHTTGFS